MAEANQRSMRRRTCGGSRRRRTRRGCTEVPRRERSVGPSFYGCSASSPEHLPSRSRAQWIQVLLLEGVKPHLILSRPQGCSREALLRAATTFNGQLPPCSPLSLTATGIAIGSDELSSVNQRIYISTGLRCFRPAHSYTGAIGYG